MNELFTEATDLLCRPKQSVKMAAPSQRGSSQRFSAQQALLLLDQWNADSDSDSSCSTPVGSGSESSESDGDIATAPVRPRHRAPSASTTSTVSRVTLTGPAPAATASTSTGSTTGRPSSKKARREPPERSPWVDVSASTTDSPGQSFRFQPPRTPGVNANLDDSATPLDCLFTLLTPVILDNMIRLINDYAQKQTQMNTPARRRSVFANMKPVNNVDILKLMSVLIAMGLNKRPSIKDYWSKFPADYSPWYHKMFPRDRFEAIYHTMLHVSEIVRNQRRRLSHS